MRASCLLAFVLVLLLPSAAAAHRLDEYLQAARVAVAMDAVGVELDLTPGVGVARAVSARIDRDADGTITPAEAETYGRAVLADLELSVNGHGVPLRLTRIESPTIGEMLDGVGTIRLNVRAQTAAGSSGGMTVRFSNHHAPDESVYLVNALKPSDRSLTLGRQSRDVHQRAIDLEYAIHPGRAGAVGWSLLGVSIVLGLVRLRA